MYIEMALTVTVITALIYLFAKYLYAKNSVRKIYNYNLLFATPVYADNSEGCKVLYSIKHNIHGKPDLIYKRFGKFIPIELKSGSINDNASPRHGDIMQLAAYFLITAENYGTVSFGLIKYNDYTFIVPNTKYLKNELLNNVSRMRQMLESGEEEHNASFVTCKYCLMQGTVCEFCISSREQ